MGAWDTTPFGNDDASDFLFGLEEASSAATALRGAFEAVLGADDYVEGPEGSVAVAAAAVVAEALGGSVEGVPEEIRQRIIALGLTAESARELAEGASAALDRVQGDNSELLELWQEAGEDEDFRRSLQNLSAGLA
jgi:hypothetical protein